MQDKKAEVLIIGGGLCGLSFAYQLYKQNISFQIFTKRENHSTAIAAGLINPIVFRRTTKSWNVDDFLPVAKEFYQEIENLIGTKIWADIKIRRSFSHEQEAQDWVRKKKNPNYDAYLGEMNTETPKHIFQEYGTGIVESAARVNAIPFMNGLRDFFETKNLLSYQEFNEEDLPALSKQFSKIVFCEGYESIHNLLFSYLPLDPTKGQTLTITSDDIPKNESINRKCFVLPLEGNEYKVGATYEWSNSTLDTTEEGKSLLQSDFENLIKTDYTIVNQIAGVRPTVKDRRPLLGQHPTQTNCYILNGMGTKGYLIAPAMSKLMCSYLFNGELLPDDIDIKRYQNLYS